MSEAPTITLSPLIWEGDRVSLAKALVAAQKASESIKKAASNDHFKSKYADLAHVVEAVVPALNNAGVAVIQSPSSDGQLVAVTTVLLHESGASVTSTLHLRPTKPDPQGVGSAITYARRYALLAMTGAAPEDDDGNAASAKPSTRGQAVGRQDPNSLAQKKRDGLMEQWYAAIDACADLGELRQWWTDHAPEIAALPQIWQDGVSDRKEARKRELQHLHLSSELDSQFAATVAA